MTNSFKIRSIILMTQVFLIAFQIYAIFGSSDIIVKAVVLLMPVPVLLLTAVICLIKD